MLSKEASDVDRSIPGLAMNPKFTKVSNISRRIHGWSWQAVGTLCYPQPIHILICDMQFPIGMGTGAVYVCLAGIHPHPGLPLTMVETVFYFLNIALFLLNSTTLLLQLIRESSPFPPPPCTWRSSCSCSMCVVYPRQAKRLITDPSKGIFVPLIVCLWTCRLSFLDSRLFHMQVLSFATIIIGTINYVLPTGHVSPTFIYCLFWCVRFSLSP